MKKAIQKNFALILTGSMLLITACSNIENSAGTVSNTSISNSTTSESSIETTENKDEVTKLENTIQTKEPSLVWSFTTEGKVNASAILVDGVLFFGSEDGNFYAVSQETGTKIWSYSFGQPIFCQAAYQDGTLFFCGKEIYVAVDSTTGKEIWRKDMTDITTQIRRRDCWDYHDSSPVIDNETVYFGSVSGMIYGFDMKTGELTWKVIRENAGAVRGTVAIADGVLYYGDWYGYYRAVSLADKQIVWEVTTGATYQSAPMISDGVIFFGGRDKKISALSITNGETLWEYFDDQGSWITGDPIIYDQVLYVSTSDAKKVYAMNLTDGTVKTEYPIYKNSFSKVVAEQGKLYVTSGDAYATPGTGKVQIYDLTNPTTPLYEYTSEEGCIFSSPVVDKNMVYFGCSDNKFYAIKCGD